MKVSRNKKFICKVIHLLNAYKMKSFGVLHCRIKGLPITLKTKGEDITKLCYFLSVEVSMISFMDHKILRYCKGILYSWIFFIEKRSDICHSLGVVGIKNKWKNLSFLHLFIYICLNFWWFFFFFLGENKWTKFIAQKRFLVTFTTCLMKGKAHGLETLWKCMLDSTTSLF